MKQVRNTILGLMASLVAATAFSTTAHAQAAPTHVAVVDLQKVYQTMQETKDWQDRLSGLQGQLKTMQESHQAQLKDLQQSLTSSLKPGTPEYEAKVAELDEKSIKFNLDETAMKVKMSREANRTLKTEFDEIQATVKAIATQQGIDLVLVMTNPEIPEAAVDGTDFEHLAQGVFSRNTLFASEKVNLTVQVIAQLDAQHKTAPVAPPH